LPLTNVAVLDFSHLLPGELCSTILCDLGCDVTRVESLKPGLAQRLPPIIKGESLYYWSIHREKSRIALDLKQPAAVEIILRLTGQCDVVIENFRPGVMERLGIGYSALHEYNPRLIYCSISGYGQTSAWSQRPGHDLNFVAESGVLSQTASPDGEPKVTGLLVSDYMSATYAALSVVAALYEREQTGKGRHLDISMFESSLSTVNLPATAWLYMGKPMRESDPAYRDGLANYNVYRCKDEKYLAVASLEPQFWEEFCRRLERPDLIGKYPLGPNQEMKEALAAIIATKTRSQWSEIFADGDCCVSPVNSILEACQYPPAQERQALCAIEHPTLGTVPQLRTPTPFASRTGDSLKAPPDPARYTRTVLQKLGYSADLIDELAVQAVIPPLVASEIS
jgi:crotonobetainyl-CoA:carnitine CoA-transferase CaiB-like acyl-CoA transferase